VVGYDLSGFPHAAVSDMGHKANNVATLLTFEAVKALMWRDSEAAVISFAGRALASELPRTAFELEPESVGYVFDFDPCFQIREIDIAHRGLTDSR
jgi:hypothetical protein